MLRELAFNLLDLLIIDGQGNIKKEDKIVCNKRSISRFLDKLD